MPRFQVSQKRRDLGHPAPCLAEFPFREKRTKNFASPRFFGPRRRKIPTGAAFRFLRIIMPYNRLGYSVWPLPMLCLCLATPLFGASDCLPIREAKQHVGETKCVMGKVLRVKAGARGVHFVDFCEDHMACPFTVVVFPHDLKDVGDVRSLAGQMIEIRGPVKLYDGRAEIILSRVSQLTGGSTLIPPLPKNYDVEKQGHYSAGRLRPPKKPAKTYGTPNSTATYGNEADVGGDPPQW
jgi:hypothetical protein